MKYFKLADSPQYDDTSVKADISALQTGKVDKVDGMSLIEDTEKERLSTITNDVATTTKNGLMSATDKKKLNGLATVATTGSYNDLKDKPSTSDYTVFMQETQPTQEGLWIKGTKKDFMFTSYIPLFVDLLSTTLPSARYDASAVAINGKAYIFGGHDSKSIFEFDPVAKTCTSMSVSLPSVRYDASAVAINDKAYIFGGRNGSIADDILEFDPVAKTCTKMSITLPSARYGTSAVVINDKAYIFGGSDWSYDYKSIFEFDPVAKTCTSMSVSLPSVRYDASAVAINDKAYIFGGRNGSIADDILEFDPVAKTCTKMSITLPSARYGTSAVVINGKAYIFGGRNGSTLSDILELHSLDFAGYYIKTCTLPDGQFTKISSYETSSIEKVYDSQTGTAMEAYSVLNGVATKIE